MPIPKLLSIVNQAILDNLVMLSEEEISQFRSLLGYNAGKMDEMVRENTSDGVVDTEKIYSEYIRNGMMEKIVKTSLDMKANGKEGEYEAARYYAKQFTSEEIIRALYLLVSFNEKSS